MLMLPLIPASYLAFLLQHRPNQMVDFGEVFEGRLPQEIHLPFAINEVGI